MNADDLSTEEIVRRAIAVCVSQAMKAVTEGRLREAERHYRNWISLAPNDPDPRYGLSTTLLTLGEYEEGFSLYEARTEIVGGVIKPEYVPPDS